MNATYLRLEALRVFRNKQNFIFSLIFPLVLFFVIVGTAGKGAPQIYGVSFATYYMSGMIGFGALGAIIAGGARIALERDLGWNRQLRITPLTPRAYIRSKVIVAYMTAAISIVLIYAAGISMGVHMPVSRWLQMTGLILVALIPFAAMGVMLGHLIKGDAMGPAMGGGMSLFALLGGSWFPIGQDAGFMHDLVRLIPSFWLVQAGRSAVPGAQPWTGEAWIVIAVWALLLAVGAVWAYRRDTQRA
ncbi:MAG: ABC transporter permease [Jatrophihabitans sp.]|nr:MAG: ABC transporter permease [Jatrophihabitans sp.]